jgi:hypothetical protein
VTKSPGHRLPIGYHFTAPQRPAFPYVIRLPRPANGARRLGAEKRKKYPDSNIGEFLNDSCQKSLFPTAIFSALNVREIWLEFDCL